MNNRAPLAGLRIGHLVVSHVVRTEQRGAVWHCVCDCGHGTERLAVQLNEAREMNRASSCPDCRDVRRRLRPSSRSNFVRRSLEKQDDPLAIRFDETALDVARDLERAGFPSPSTDPLRLRGPIFAAEPDGTHDDDPDAEERSEMSTREERADGVTLEEVGRELGVTRERARQIEAKAIRKLRRAFLAMGWANADGDSTRRRRTA